MKKQYTYDTQRKARLLQFEQVWWMLWISIDWLHSMFCSFLTIGLPLSLRTSCHSPQTFFVIIYQRNVFSHYKPSFSLSFCKGNGKGNNMMKNTDILVFKNYEMLWRRQQSQHNQLTQFLCYVFWVHHSCIGSNLIPQECNCFTYF